MELIRFYYTLEEKTGYYLQNPFLLLVRLYWGWLFWRAGYWKFTHYDNTVKFFGSLGLPSPEVMVLFIASVEFVGGLMLAFGIFSRFSALVLTGNMIGAYLVAHSDELFSIFSKPEDFYSAPPFTFLFASLIILTFGSGLFSIDYLIRRHIFKSKGGL